MNLNSKQSSTVASTTLPREKSQHRSLFRYPFVRTLRRMRRGNLSVRFPDGEVVHFGGDEAGARCAQMVIHREQFFKRCALYGGVGLGEAYVDGDWDSSDLRAVIEWFIDNIANEKHMRCSSQRFRTVGWLRTLNRIGHRLRPNSMLHSRRNIAEHYDLGNDFYKLWLDPTMTYSGARFTSPDQTLECAQLAKYDALCQKLRLKGEDHLLEIGCGWGGFSCYAAQTYGCRITAVTISEAQFEEAARRVEEAGLTDRVEVRLQDYREIEGSFDKIASIEMLEAVGHKYHETYFSKCDELLARDGLLAVQMITVPDDQYEDLRKGADFIQKHIFPGSLLLSVGRVTDILGQTGDLFLHGLEDLGAGYARTLREWHENFNKCLSQVREQGFSEEFIRKWNYYMKYCEAAFASRNISVVQAVYTRPNNHACLHCEDGIDTLSTR